MAEGRVDKRDEGKAPMGLLACVWEELGDVARVLKFGNRKYKTIWNYQTIDDGYERMSDAAIRHMMKALAGEKLDPESGCPHLAHAACDALMALWFEKNKPSSAVRVHEVWSKPAEAAPELWEVWVQPDTGKPYRSLDYPDLYDDKAWQNISPIELIGGHYFKHGHSVPKNWFDGTPGAV